MKAAYVCVCVYRQEGGRIEEEKAEAEIQIARTEALEIPIPSTKVL